MIIDADAHVLEGDRTWDYLAPDEEKFRPMRVPGWWIVNGVARSRTFDDVNIPDEVRQLTDVKGRLERMDEMGVDIQVVYPSLQLGPTTEHADALLAICRSYNRFLADASDKSGGRLRWVVIPPVETMPEALAEVDFAVQHGACGVFLRGIEGTRTLANHYFDPLYEKAQALNLPICIHAGLGNKVMADITYQDDWPFAQLPVLGAFESLLMQRVPDRFPTLRFGFIEAGAQWVPHMVHEAVRAAGVRERQGRGYRGVPKEEARVIPEKRFYISCRVDEEIEHILQWAGPKNLITGTDYGHDDTATELFAFDTLEGKGEIDKETIAGIKGENAKVFYNL